MARNNKSAPSTETMDITELVTRRLADGRQIADIDIHRLLDEINRLKKIVHSFGGSV